MSNGPERMSRGGLTFTVLSAAIAMTATAMTMSACGSTPAGGHQIAGSAGSGSGAAGNLGAAGGSPSGAAGDAAGAAGANGGAGSGAGGTGPTAGSATCQNYCSTIMTNCSGVNAQYPSTAVCMAVCSHLQAGAPTDATGDSVGCRTNAAKGAMAQTTAIKDKCWAAGPLGFGTCGNECDILCPLVANACGAMAKYTPDCQSVCSQFGHPVDQVGVPGMGAYSGNYTPPTDPVAKDTLDCRAYHFFDVLLGMGGSAATECANVSQVSPACGMGPDTSIPDAGTANPDAGPVPTYDGGLVNIINSTNWTETKYPPAMRKMLLRDEGDPHMVMIDLSKTPILQWKTVAEGPWARASQLIGGNQILGGTSTGYQVFDYTTGMITKTVKGFGNTQSAYRTVNGETMLTTSGTVLKFLDKNDAMVRQISYPGYGYVRVGRPTRNGTFLIPSDTKLFEGDATGKVL